MKKVLSRIVASVFSVGLAFNLLPLLPQQASAAISSWQKGFSIQQRSAQDFGSATFDQSVVNAKAAGANYISLIIPYYQSNAGSTDIQGGWNTPSDASLIAAVKYIHSQGMQVMLKPHLDTYGGDWRANINPGDRDTWFKNYGAMLDHLADIGKQTGAEEMSVGSELISMSTYTSNPDNTARWQALIAGVRSRYSGLLTYSANWGSGDFADEKAHIGFWGSLDYIGISAYFDLNTSGDVNSLKSAWDGYNMNEIKPLATKFGKRVLFTEIGYRSVTNAHTLPWNSSMGGGYDPTEQSNDYTALFDYWNGQPFMAGVQLWDWSSDPNAGGSGNIDYTVQNKPAQDVVKTWFGANTNTNPGTAGVNGTFSATGGAAPSKKIIHKPVTLQPSVSINGTASDALVDVEVYDSSNTQVFQKFFPGESFAQNETKNYSTVWTPSATGNYALTVGVFNQDWTKNYYWNSVLSMNVEDDTGSPGTTTNPVTGPVSNTYSTNIWWPANNASVQGIQPFKANVDGLDVAQYKMYWQVDGDVLNEMQNSAADYPHKEALVDVSGWNWKGNGPYTINFVSKDLSGNAISAKSTSISVQH